MVCSGPQSRLQGSTGGAQECLGLPLDGLLQNFIQNYHFHFWPTQKVSATGHLGARQSLPEAQWRSLFTSGFS